MFGAIAGLFLTVSSLGTVAQLNGPLRESNDADSTLEARAQDGDRQAADLRRFLRRRQIELAAGLDPAVSMSRDWRDDLRERSAVQGVLGNDRWRRLGDARFQLQLRELQGYNDQQDLRDLPMVYEQVEDSLRSNFGKLARDYVEERLGFDDWLDRKRDRLRGRSDDSEDEDGDGERRSSGIRVSPRVSLGSNSYLGAKLQLRSSPLLSRFGLRMSHAIDGSDMGLKLTYDKGPQRFLLEQRFNHPERGDTIAFSMRMSLNIF